jgi:PAS domain S-box-containing protein
VVEVNHALERLARRVGGVRVLALPFIRILAIIAGYLWVLLAPESYTGWDAVDLILLGFLVWSGLVIAALWIHPAPTLRLNLLVLGVDLAFALAIIRATGGARSTMFLALLLIAGLQSYYYGLGRGLGVAGASAGAYLAVVWPTLGDMDTANMAIRIAVLLGTAIGVGLLADVEERERTKVLALSREAAQREQFVRNVLESLTEGLVVLDRDGRVAAWNRAMEKICGRAAREVLGRGLLEVIPACGVGHLREPLERLLRGETPEMAVDGLERRAAGRAQVLNVKGSLLTEDGTPAGAVLLVEDVTERLGLERAARQADKLAALGTLAAGLAHELNNPIAIISSRAELMLMEADMPGVPPALREDLEVLHRHAQRVARIVQGLLAFARRGPGRLEPVDLNQVVDDTLFLVERQISKDGLVLVRRLRPGLPPIHGDASALQQVLMNLVLNARDALQGHPGQILVETDVTPGQPGWVRLRVRDTGPGIPPEILPRIFDPFFTTKPEGTGLGLSISYGIVRDHHGTVDVESEPGRGTTFVVSFPVHPVEAAA